jgi:hypothetical protein
MNPMAMGFTKFTVIESRGHLTVQALKDNEYGWNVNGATRVWTFKAGGCRCSAQDLNPVHRNWTNAQPVKGYDGLVFRRVRCCACDYVYETAPALIMVDEVLGDLNRKIEVIYFREVDATKLLPYIRLVTKVSGKVAYTGEELVTDLEALVRWQYPGKEVIPVKGSERPLP